MGSMGEQPSVAPAPAPFSLEGKVALVTGSGRGIGAAMAVELARCGAKVIVNYAKSAGPAQKVVQQIRSLGSEAVAIQADVSKVPETERLFVEAYAVFNQLDIVCSNAGVVSFGHLEDVTEEEFDRVFNINTRGQFFVAREAYKHLGEGGRIILMSSNTAINFTVPKHSLYSASKGAINTFVRCLAKDCGKKKITINGVAPGGTITDMFYDTAKDYLPNADSMTEQQILDIVASVSPLNRCGYPTDIANVVCFLASKQSEWINGKVLGIDGGAA
ncbi:Short chain dehydrogenase AgnL6 [Elasticomyces elasticus]|uniref:Short chain dehydrogenase AgnL6 n=1 Tax=Elasticomyces elasticus TaxID=574655 RepID=A0AAN7W264_9PEZI|nr:Short chain dehydrogenase AgnL6 [Elasticomyces elasticus]KAK3630978.1 Short chain dehydrogenase AgnL6 [Elasticomyces elasticus]KAK4908791.1 Short chain dehydrogenase AgnL6 [Elasticomyces elasticus]KAK5690390.1 Short chain dehydrogenase AgnL6 [Elasticomyces elasticus]KAK5748793.1 Short chain dehydrogenase AgnL6 [Elasticomyces elasticus]